MVFVVVVTNSNIEQLWTFLRRVEMCRVDSCSQSTAHLFTLHTAGKQENNVWEGSITKIDMLIFLE